MVAAARSAGGKEAATAAANHVYEAELDRVLELGWAHADRASFDAFAAELASAPASAKGALQVRHQPCQTAAMRGSTACCSVVLGFLRVVL